MPDRFGAARALRQDPPICRQAGQMRDQRQLAAGNRLGVLGRAGQHQPDGQSEQHHAQSQHRMGDVVGLAGQDSVLRPMKRNCTAVMAITILSTRNSTRLAPQTRFDRVWFDFFDTFGIVWGRRIQDRVNFIAQKENWPLRLELDGFVANEGRAPAEVDPLKLDPSNTSVKQPAMDQTAHEEFVAARMDHTLRWLLRRFVDPGWIDERLESTRSQEANHLTIDS